MWTVSKLHETERDRQTDRPWSLRCFSSLILLMVTFVSSRFLCLSALKHFRGMTGSQCTAPIAQCFGPLPKLDSWKYQCVVLALGVTRRSLSRAQTETDRDRQRQTETDRDRQRQTETDRDRQRQTETDRETETGRQADRQTDRQMDGRTDGRTDGQTEGQTDGQTPNRQSGKPTKILRGINKQSKTEIERQR